MMAATTAVVPDLSFVSKKLCSVIRKASVNEAAMASYDNNAGDEPRGFLIADVDTDDTDEDVDDVTKGDFVFEHDGIVAVVSN